MLKRSPGRCLSASARVFSFSLVAVFRVKLPAEKSTSLSSSSSLPTRLARNEKGAVTAFLMMFPSALKMIERVRPRRAVLTHMTSQLDYRTLRDELPDGVQPAYDGMVL